MQTMLMTTSILKAEFDSAKPFKEFIARMSLNHQPQWRERYGRLELSGPQQAVVDSFSRSMNILCLTGPWCGDCALQGAAFARIADASGGKIALRFLVRDEETIELMARNRINGLRLRPDAYSR